MDLNEIQAFLDKGIITVKQKENTFLDIAGFPHYENVISNIYAYFFNPNQKHGLGTLFLDSLKELIKSDFVFNSPKVEREYNTKRGGRIDLVILDQDKQEEKVFIIENKMFHFLNNDLKDYYDTFPGIERAGVLLTINPATSYHSKFTNVTHKDLLNKVFSNLGQIILTIPEQSLFILKEFSKNLNNFTMNHEVGTYYDFYQKNIKNIEAVKKLTNKLKSHMWSQIELGPQLLPDLNLEISARYNEKLRYYRSKKTDNVFFMLYPTILNAANAKIRIVVELNSPGIERIEEVNGILFTEEEKTYLHENTAKRKTWLHYASKTFDLENGDFENLGEFIKIKIESTPLKSIFMKVENYFASNPKVKLK